MYPIWKRDYVGAHAAIHDGVFWLMKMGKDR
jgi:hypothetical protein